MEDRIYKHIELTGSSHEGIEDAAKKAVARAGKTLQHLHGFEVIDIRAIVGGNAQLLWQVTINAAFTLDE